MKKLHFVTFLLLFIGGLNWGLYALGYGIDMFLPGWLTTLIYYLVAISAIVELISHKSNCMMCNDGVCSSCGHDACTCDGSSGTGNMSHDKMSEHGHMDRHKDGHNGQQHH